jgi:hypothetical protein
MRKSLALKKGMLVRLNRHPMVGEVTATYPRTETVRVMFYLCSKKVPVSIVTRVDVRHVLFTDVGPLDRSFVWG